MTGATQDDVRLRSDAARNRRAIIASARELYGRRGLEAPLDEIARGAGVGNATVYRHFPSRCVLVAAAFTEMLHQIIEASEEGLARDPWVGFTDHVRYLCKLQATDRGLAELLTTEVADAPGLEELRGRAYRNFVRLADRARAAGKLRPDFVTEDLVLLLMANAGLVHRTDEVAPAAWARFVDVVIDGLHTVAASPSAPPPTPDEIEQAMKRHGRELGYG